MGLVTSGLSVGSTTRDFRFTCVVSQETQRRVFRMERFADNLARWTFQTVLVLVVAALYLVLVLLEELS